MALTFGWVKALKKLVTPEKVRSVPVGDDPSHRVATGYKGKLLTTPREGVATLYDISSDSFKRYGDRKCMGTREFLGQHNGNPKVKHFGGINWRTFEEVGTDSLKFGAALRSAGLVPAADKGTLDKISTPCSLAIFENTSAEWMIAAQGAFSQSIIVTA